MKDFGYDVSDYRDVDPMFGTLGRPQRCSSPTRRSVESGSSWISLPTTVPTSTPGSSRRARPRPRRKHGWYLWVPDTGRPPNNWKAIFELGTAWHPNPATGERYLGTFTRHQPEFDWRNGELREAIYDVMRYWYELGVDGFRLDVATGYLKDSKLRSNPFSLKANPDFFQRHVYDRNQAEFHEIFKEMRAVADAAGERVLIGETHGQDTVLAASCYGAKGDELHMAFNFDFLFRPWGAESFRESAERWYAALPEGAWPNFTLSNHDQPRHAWRYRAGAAAPRPARASPRPCCLRSAELPFLYYGEELGHDLRAPPSRRAARSSRHRDLAPEVPRARSRKRTPMQWDATENAGFSSGRTWLPVNSDYASRNASAQERDPASLLSWYKALIALRRARPELREGAIAFLDAGSGRPRL